MNSALDPTSSIDSDHPDVADFAREAAAGARDSRARAVALYYAVRDGIRYDPYSLEMTVPGLRASTTLAARRGWCVPKAILLAGCCRAVGVPARLGYADVRNHLSTERLRKFMSTDVFYWHGYTAIGLNGRWVKATPAFNVELCEKFRIRPLEFDGTEDSIYHPFDLDGREHMEYLKFRGEYDDIPLDAIMATYSAHYSESMLETPGGDFEREAEEENRGT